MNKLLELQLLLQGAYAAALDPDPDQPALATGLIDKASAIVEKMITEMNKVDQQ